ncbi:MAG: flavin reductase [Rhodothermales bacterium]|nr:flavin reductase [Rhodothermales bacterium]
MEEPDLIALDTSRPVWDRFFTVAPLVVIGTCEGERYDLAPKHMVTPVGWQNYFGFVCTPRHATYHNAKHHGAFTVTFPRPSDVVLASLSASPRCDRNGHKPALDGLPTFPARVVEGVFLADGYLFLECELDRVVDGFGSNSLLVGRVVAAQALRAALRVSDRDGAEVVRDVPLLAYVAPGRYAEVAATHAFPFPAHFQR